MVSINEMSKYNIKLAMGFISYAFEFRLSLFCMSLL